VRTRWWANIAMFASSYSPMVLIIAARDWDVNAHFFDHPRILLATAFLVLLCTVASVAIVKTVKTGIEVQVQRVHDRSNDVVNYTIPYIVAFVGIDLGDVRDLFAFALFMLLLFLIAVRTRSLFINPILLFFGYGIYDVDFIDHGKEKSNLMLAKQGLHPGQRCRIEPLSPYLLLVTSVAA
jgi:hypothetical protein